MLNFWRLQQSEAKRREEDCFIIGHEDDESSLERTRLASTDNHFLAVRSQQAIVADNLQLKSSHEMLGDCSDGCAHAFMNLCCGIIAVLVSMSQPLAQPASVCPLQSGFC
jgi:hypothetical protein